MYFKIMTLTKVVLLFAYSDKKIIFREGVNSHHEQDLVQKLADTYWGYFKGFALMVTKFDNCMRW